MGPGLIEKELGPESQLFSRRFVAPLIVSLSNNFFATELSSWDMEVSTAAPLSAPHIQEVLHRKRQSLDLEIEEYKALKEEEFRKYEAEIRHVLQEQEVNGATEEKARDETIVSHGHIAKDIATGSRRNSDEKSHTGTMHQRLRSENGVKTERQDDSITTQQPAASTDIPLVTPSHERELDFHGIFTPKYLPLLDNPNRYSRQAIAKPSPPSSPISTDTHRGRHEPSTPLSSSASLPATVYDPLRSPPQTPKLSNSAPRPRLLGQRRSSSRSDSSITSLRSSLRQPKSPRSPKHVLFAIDNTVLSPSTSPVAHRPNRNPPISFSRLSDMPKPTAEHKDSAAERKSNGTPSGHPVHTKSPGTRLTGQALSYPVKSYQQLVEPTTQIATSGNEDFEDLGPQEDALFSFDEDVHVDDDESTDNENVRYHHKLL